MEVPSESGLGNKKFSSNHTLDGSVVAAKKAKQCPSGVGMADENFTGPFSQTVSIVPSRYTLKRAQASERRGVATFLAAPTQRLLPSAATPPISPNPAPTQLSACRRPWPICECWLLVSSPRSRCAGKYQFKGSVARGQTFSRTLGLCLGSFPSSAGG